MLPLCHVLMPFSILRHYTSVFLQRGGLCETHRLFFLQGAGACVLTPSRVSAAQGMAEGGRCQARFYDGRSIQRGASSLQLYYFGRLYMAWPDSRERSVIIRRRRCPAPLQNFPLLWLRRRDTLPLHPLN